MNKGKKMNNVQDKVRGMFLGVAIGDGLGKPVETWSADRIKEKFGRITQYEDCSNHKFFENDAKGTTTDDYQLTKAIAKAFIRTGMFDLKAIAEEQVKEFAISVRGWGGSTRDSFAKIASGEHWKDAGKTNLVGRGTGNGICMKVSPIGLYLSLTNGKFIDYAPYIADVSGMSHCTSIAVTSGFAQVLAINYCFENDVNSFSEDSFSNLILGSADLGKLFYPDTITDKIQDRFELIDKYVMSDDIIEAFKGTCYVYDSLPFTYAFFLRNPFSIDSLYDCISAGADTDTNGSMLGGLLGALHGVSIFPDHLIDGLQQKDEVFDLADQFYEKFR